MNKIFAVIGGQVFISQAVVEQAASAISKAVVMDCGTGELKFAEKPAALGDEFLLEQLRQAAENVDRAKADEAIATYVMTLGRMVGDDAAGDGKLLAVGIGAGVADDKPTDSIWSIKIGVTPGGTFYCAGIGPA